MAIFKRISDILRANISELLNEAEDPEKMIKLYLEDAKTQLIQMTNAVADAIAAEKLLQKQYTTISDEIAHWENHAVEAVKLSKDDLAEKALQNQVKCEERLKNLSIPLEDAKNQTIKMKKNLNILKEKIEETESNATVLIARAKAAKALKTSSEAMSKISGNSPLDQMNSMEEKISQTEAQAEALQETSKSSFQTTEDEFAALSTSNSVADKLAALKAKVNAA